MNTTRREFIKLLAGTVIAIQLPIGLLSGNKIGFADDNIKFTLGNIKVKPLTLSYDYVVTGAAIPKNRKLSKLYWAVKIDDINKYVKDLKFRKVILDDVKFIVRKTFIKKLGG